VRRPRLRTVLILLNLIVLALPLAGIQVLRLYESALVRQTESELIAQAAFIAAAYRSAFDRVLAYEQPKGKTSELDRHSRAQRSADASQGVTYRAPILDLVDSTILPPQPEPATLPAKTRPDRLAYIIGQDLESILKDAQRMTLAAIRIVDHNGIVVATTGEDRYTHLLDTEEVVLALDGQHVSRLRTKEDIVHQTPLQSVSRTSRIRAFVATPILFEDRILGVVLLSRTPANIVQALYAKGQLLAYAAALLLGVVVLIAFIASKTIMRPIGVIQDLARRVSQGDERAMDDLRPGGTAEIVALGEQIKVMGRNLADRRRYVQEFARHVSHEFKTPLTGLRGAIEMFEDHSETMTASQRDRFLANMNGDVTHLHRLTNSLLMLAKADMQDPAVDASTNVNALLTELRTNFRSDSTCNMNSSDRVYPTISLSLPDAVQTVAASAEAITAALTQLLENTVVHGKTATEITIELSPHVQRDRMVRIIVGDNGEGISAGNQLKVLQPFFTTAKSSGGTGLGLAIASRLLASQGGTLSLLPPEPQRGAHFLLELPPAVKRN